MAKAKTDKKASAIAAKQEAENLKKKKMAQKKESSSTDVRDADDSAVGRCWHVAAPCMQLCLRPSLHGLLR